MSPQNTETLPSWEDIKTAHPWNGLLIGNGASRSVWDSFAYPSLYEAAKSQDLSSSLSLDDQALFASFNTTNFESILSALMTSKIVEEVFGKDVTHLSQRYESIRKALVEAVHAKHIPHASVSLGKLQAIRQEIRSYKWVYSTNYDLLTYWAIMSTDPPANGFVDFFFSANGAFDPLDTEIRETRTASKTRILYLHGGLHLQHTVGGSSYKMRAGGGTLLEQFGGSMEMDTGRVPLFIAEGRASEKLSAIYRSDYLSFAYAQLEQHSSPLVVFGHSLGESDKHIVKAIKRASTRTLAISIYPSNPADIREEITRYTHLFHEANWTLLFFDATTHPLGQASLKVPA